MAVKAASNNGGRGGTEAAAVGIFSNYAAVPLFFPPQVLSAAGGTAAFIPWRDPAVAVPSWWVPHRSPKVDWSSQFAVLRPRCPVYLSQPPSNLVDRAAAKAVCYKVLGSPLCGVPDYPPRHLPHPPAPLVPASLTRPPSRRRPEPGP